MFQPMKLMSGRSVRSTTSFLRKDQSLSFLLPLHCSFIFFLRYYSFTLCIFRMIPSLQ